MHLIVAVLFVVVVVACAVAYVVRPRDERVGVMESGRSHLREGGLDELA